MDKPIIHSRSDAFFTYAGDVVTIEHQNNLFNKMTINWRDPLMYLVEVYKNDESGVRVLLDTKWAYYFLVKDEKVIHPPLWKFDVARQLVDEFNYIQWRDMQNTRGLPKKQFISDVMGGKMMARRTFCRMSSHNVDNKFYPLVKTKGKGSIDIDRDGDASVVFYLDSMKSCLLYYSGEKLVIYNGGYRLYNEEETKCVVDWEKMRDYKEEMLDVMTDGSEQFYRKQDFFTSRGCGHLLNQRFSGLVQDDSIRESVSLEYSILKLR